MCPGCFASVGLVVGSVISTGGLTALVARVLRKKKVKKNDSQHNDLQRNDSQHKEQGS